ncbi:MAG: hypothetical protein J6Y28_04745 [Acholeplasmatales bacterium]|nr:hypothetical protein [Methanobrevibacter sp.]MBP5445464.1 hypothetical protein [Acholeplasmatales bacterium]
MYSEYSFPNKYGISKITLTKKIHCYCRLGGDWYTNQLEISFKPGAEIPDYVYLDKAIEERCEKQDLIIEEVINNISNIILEQCPSATDLHITSYVDDSVPKNMFVKVEKYEL